jgi:hypothetical protein
MGADRLTDFRRRSKLVFPLICLITLSASVKAQRIDPAKAAMQEMDRREMQLSNLGRNSAPTTDRKRAQAMMEQVSEDFQRILTLHNEIVRTISTNGTLELQHVSDAAGEIKKRSMRLQSSLQLPKPDASTKGETATSSHELELKDRLILLCRSIENFVRNPIIEKPGTVDAEQLQKARNDLQSMVEISDAIKKSVDKPKT